MNAIAQERLHLAKSLFHQTIDAHGQSMAGMLALLRRDEPLKQAMSENNSIALRPLVKELFETMAQRQRGLLSFSVTSHDGIHVSYPEDRGESLRQSFSSGENSADMVAGISLSTTGVPMLRVATSWFEQGNLLGQLELTEDVESLLGVLASGMGGEFFAFIDKRLVNRGAWEANLGHGKAEKFSWESFPKSLLLGKKHPELVNGLKAQPGIIDSPTPASIGLQGRQYLGASFGLMDSSGKALGQALWLQDTSDMRQMMRTTTWIYAAGSVLFSAMLIGFVGKRVSRIERKAKQAGQVLAESKSHLEQEVARRTREMTAVNSRLRKEVLERDQAEQKLLRNQMFLLTVLDSLAYPFVVVDARDFNIKLANRAAMRGTENTSGVTTCHGLIYGQDYPCIGRTMPCVLREVHRVKQPVMVEHRFIDESGVPAVYEVHAYPVLSSQGQVEQIIEYFIDITERKRAEESLSASEHNYRELVEATNCIVLRWDTEGRILFINGYGQKFFGYHGSELIGQSVTDTIVPRIERGGRDLSAMILDIISHPEKYEYSENENLRKDGQRVWVAWANKAICDERGRVIEILSFGNDITERRRATEALGESETRLRNIYENSPVMMHSFDENGRILSVNRKWIEETGYARDEAVGRTIDFLMTPETRVDVMERKIAQLWEKGALRNVECQFVHKDGHMIDVLVDCTVSQELDGQKTGLSVVQNVSERKRAEQELQLAASVFENSIEGILITDKNRKILRTNNAFTLVTGYSAEEASGNDPSFLASGRHDPMFYQNMWNSLNQNGFWQGEIWNRRRCGEIFPEWLGISTVYDTNHEPIYYVGVFTDITDKKLSEKRIYQLAHYDALTALPNRVLFQDRLEQALVEARRGGHMVPILYLDLDRFKPINDSFGHPVGDLLLQQVAERLRLSVREADTVARMGGDEFTVLLRMGSGTGGLDVVQRGSRVARVILEALAQPFDLEGHEVFVSASVGIVVYPQDGSTVAELIKNADTAMYHAKSKGRNNYLFYETHMNATAVDRLLIENSLRRALERSEFELFYQPSVDIKEGRIDSLEALLRWRHPELGMVYPDQFIALAEESGLIVPIGEWVLREAVRQVAQWRSAGFSTLRVAVNLSLRQFRHRELMNVIRQAVEEVGLGASVLSIEVTESAFMEDEEDTIARLNEMSEMGIQILIDDFGTGYSSLARLRTLPIHVLKIDRSFVRDITTDPNDASIISAIIAMAHNLQLKVIAEGVETVSQLNFLRSRDCEEVQGYLFSKPLPASEVIEILKNGALIPAD